VDEQIGTVTHYYDKIGVAVVDVINHSLALGDTVKISGHDHEFTQTISSIEIDHKRVKSAASGEECAIKTDEPVKAGDRIYRIT